MKKRAAQKLLSVFAPSHKVSQVLPVLWENTGTTALKINGQMKDKKRMCDNGKLTFGFYSSGTA